MSETRAVAIALLEWVDAVPSGTVLPAMPGIDRDWIDSVLFGTAMENNPYQKTMATEETWMEETRQVAAQCRSMPVMPLSEAAEFFKAHSEWLSENWSMTPEGREYRAKFDRAVESIFVHTL